MAEVQVDLLAYMATVESTNDPLEMCNSCQRAYLYGAMMYASDVGLELQKALETRNIAHVERAIKSLNTVGKILAEFVKADIFGAMPGAAELPPDAWAVAIESFVQARTEHFVSPEGFIKFEPHNVEGDVDLFGDEEPPGVTA